MKFPILLGVNVDHIATVRQARGTSYPDPVHGALSAEHAGADLITMHLREDRRHIQDVDVERAAESLKTRLNLEMAVTDEMLCIAERLKPSDCCLVPEKREELTTEGGLNVLGQKEKLQDACARLNDANVLVSIFIDPDNAQLDAAKSVGAPVVEIHTGAYADAETRQQKQLELEKITHAVAHANSIGLKVNAGHGLTLHNLAPIASILPICELNIGHALMADAMFMGLEQAVQRYKKAMVQARHQALLSQ